MSLNPPFSKFDLIPRSSKNHDSLIPIVPPTLPGSISRIIDTNYKEKGADLFLVNNKIFMKELQLKKELPYAKELLEHLQFAESLVSKTAPRPEHVPFPKPVPIPKPEVKRIEFIDLKKKFKTNVVDVVKQRKIMKNLSRAEVIYDMKENRFTNQNIQNVLYGKRDITFLFKTITNNVYCVIFSKFTKTPSENWQIDPNYRIYVLFKNERISNGVWKRKGIANENEMVEENQKYSYGLFAETVTTIKVAKTYCGFTIRKDKSIHWNKEFSEYYSCENENESIEDGLQEEINDFVIVQWTENKKLN